MKKLDPDLQLAIDLDDYREERKKKRMPDTQLINKYRPIDFPEVIGNAEVVKALADSLGTDTRHHTYLFTGPAGVGKTTLARIVASKINASIEEHDMGSNSGVEFTRELVSASGYRPITVEPNRLYILDECHALSKQAWSPLLKLTEEPPDFLYIAFCTTEASKIPETIKSRSHCASLKPIKTREISDLIDTVAAIEGWKITGDVLSAISLASDGSARRALSILQAGHACQTREELSKVVDKVDADGQPAIELCKYLMSGKGEWRPVAKLLSEIENEEEAITIIARYLTACLARSEEPQAQNIWQMLRKFTADVSWDKKVQLYRAVGSIIWAHPMID